MTIAVMGSVAANFWNPSLWPSPKDLDLIATWESFQETLKLGIVAIPSGPKSFISKVGDKFVEWEIAWPGSSGFDLLSRLGSTPPPPSFEVCGIVCSALSLNDLFLLKTSHRYKKNSIHFEKTRQDWEKLRNLGCVIEDYDLLRKREKETYTASRPSLNQSKKNFFDDDNGIYKYDHDSIHESVAHFDRPAYLYYKKDGAEVQCDKRKWDEVSDDVRLFGVLEEAYVLALERSQIPFPDTDPFHSFKMALEKICTSITSGFFREYAYENYYRILNLYSQDYVTRFQDALHQGKIRMFES